MSRMMKLAALAALAWGAVAVPASAQEGAMATMLSVDNKRDVPIVVYLEQGAYDSRLGTVQAHHLAVLPLPISLQDGERIYFTVHPEGGADLQTPDGMRVRRGETLELVVPNNDVGFIAVPPETVPNPGIKGPTVTVDNEQGQAAVVFLERGAFDRRIGTVPAHQEKTFPIPADLTQQDATIDLFVHIEGGEDLASQEFELTPDAHLMLEVPR